MADDRFDDDGAPPPLDTTTGQSLGFVANDADDDLVAVDRERVRVIQGLISHCLATEIQPLKPMYLEVIIAFANISLVLSAHWLRESRTPTVFQFNRNEILNVVGIMSACLNAIDPPVEVVDADSPSDLVH